MCRASSSNATRWWALVAAGLAVAAFCHALEQDDGTDNATDSCPPIPNCGIGYTCKVVKHPDNCPICKCVPCDDKPCVPKEGFGCSSIQMATGCRMCRCLPCRELKSCEAPCTKQRNSAGCPVCDCPGTKGPFGTTAGNPEVESMPFDYQNDAENSFDP
uniref:Putative conserved secreted protein ovary overexpressed n=1 Tax=Rhipicephalus microplus TaxID=6941 RepID=A0A6M2D6Y3_RHIMP